MKAGSRASKLSLCASLSLILQTSDVETWNCGRQVRRDMEQQVREELRKEMVNKAKEEVDLQVEKKLKKLQEKKLAEEKEKAALAEQTQGATAEVQRLRDAQQAERQKQQELQQKLLSMQSKVRPASWVCAGVREPLVSTGMANVVGCVGQGGVRRQREPRRRVMRIKR